MLNLLYRVMQPCTIYKGVTITNCDGAYKAVGRLYATLQLAKEAIDASFTIIAESIKHSTQTDYAAKPHYL